jgi:hypothetical protein
MLSRQVASETNPKPEYRNPKQTERQINLKSGKSKTPNPNQACLEFFLFWSFEIVSNFRISCFEFFVLGDECKGDRPVAPTRKGTKDAKEMGYLRIIRS